MSTLKVSFKTFYNAINPNCGSVLSSEKLTPLINTISILAYLIYNNSILE